MTRSLFDEWSQALSLFSHLNAHKLLRHSPLCKWLCRVSRRHRHIMIQQQTNSFPRSLQCSTKDFLYEIIISGQVRQVMCIRLGSHTTVCMNHVTMSATSCGKDALLLYFCIRNSILFESCGESDLCGEIA